MRALFGKLVLMKNTACRRANRWFALQMSRPYEEILDGASFPRSAPGARHETICDRLHAAMTASVANLAGTQLLAPRTESSVSPVHGDLPRPRARDRGHRQTLAGGGNHQPRRSPADTVVKKELYEDIRVPRLWMVDPRYDNVEIYHSTEWGLKLKGILAGSEVLTEKPDSRISICHRRIVRRSAARGLISCFFA